MIANLQPPSTQTIAEAAACLKAGGLVAMPTETVYGLAANAADPQAVARLYETKGRPRFNPLIAHCADLGMAQQEGVLSAQALALAETFWPGPLTLVVDVAQSGTVCDLARAGLDSIALRIPNHPVAQDLLRRFNAPLVAPSANPSGKISPTRAEHVAADFGDKIDLILDGGPCETGIESTIIDARGRVPVLLRPGGIAPKQIEAIWPGLTYTRQVSDAPRAPGQLLRHYATAASLRLNAAAPNEGEAYLGFGSGSGSGRADLNLSKTASLSEAAANLFSMLRTLDANHARIAVAPIPNEGLGEAINDRLTRAAQTS
ncbi:MAG: L-threonylcarbamoyladenylate synthase [Henriciella sp.]